MRSVAVMGISGKMMRDPPKLTGGGMENRRGITGELGKKVVTTPRLSVLVTTFTGAQEESAGG